MAIPRIDNAVQFDDALPKSVDVVIIGGGIIGLCTAWFLNKSGKSVFICEKGRVAGEQSSRNLGWVRQQGRDESEVPIMIDAMTTWQEMSNEIGDEIGFRREGTLYLARNEKERVALESWLKVAEQYQLDTRAVSTKEIDCMVTGNTAQWCGGILTESDGRAEPFTTGPAIAGYMHAAGVGIKENCAVRCLNLDANQVKGVVTEHGRIKADKVVLAGGAWSSRFLGNHDLPLPQLQIRTTVTRTDGCE